MKPLMRFTFLRTPTVDVEIPSLGEFCRIGVAGPRVVDRSILSDPLLYLPPNDVYPHHQPNLVHVPTVACYEKGAAKYGL